VTPSLPPFRGRHYTVNMTFSVFLERDPETAYPRRRQRRISEAIELYLTPGDIDLPEDAKLCEVTVG